MRGDGIEAGAAREREIRGGVWRRGLCLAVFVLAWLVTRPVAAQQADWMFDKGLYTNDPKTGHRVDQYRKIKPVYRIPMSKFFSPDGPHPFGLWEFGFGYGYGYGGWGEPYLYSGAMPWPVLPYYEGYGGWGGGFGYPMFGL